MDLKLFEEHLVWAEGERLDMYQDSVGIWTVGVGHNIEERGISKAVSRLMLEEDMAGVVQDCRTLTYWSDLDPVRQLVIADMVFNMGLSKFLKFVDTNAALDQGNYALTAVEMKNSRWYKQVGRRAVKLCAAMKSGEWYG